MTTKLIVRDKHVSLDRLEQAKSALVEAKSLQEVKKIRDQAEALRIYARQAKDSLEIQNHCAEIKLRAERRAGEMLRDAEKNKGAAQKKKATPSQDVSTLKEAGISHMESHRWQRVASVPEAEFEQYLTETREAKKELTTAGVLNIAKASLAAHVSANTGVPEWYTPKTLVEAARKVLGTIDLDPASSEIAQRTIRATKFYSVVDDGLKQPWAGRVWMNPPYSNNLVTKFLEKFLDHFKRGDVTDGIVLVNNATETDWFQTSAAEATAICFPRTRVRFLDEAGNPGAPLQGQALMYFSQNPKDSFLKTFSHCGLCLLRA